MQTELGVAAVKVDTFPTRINVRIRLSCNLGSDRKNSESIDKEIPSKYLSVRQSEAQLVHSLQNNCAIGYHRVEVIFHALDATLKYEDKFSLYSRGGNKQLIFIKYDRHIQSYFMA